VPDLDGRCTSTDGSALVPFQVPRPSMKRKLSARGVPEVSQFISVTVVLLRARA